MLKAKDFRRYARESLRGRWLKAGGVSLLAGFLGAAISNSVSSGSTGGGTQTNDMISTNMSGAASSSPEIPAILIAIILGIGLVFLLWGIAVLVIGGATTLGYAKYNLNLVDDHDPKLQDLFSQYHRLGTGFGMQFFRGLFTFLWSLLLVIPGIIASYRYYMTPFILCENPDMTALEAINESKRLMKGNKWRLFCLELSFIGWEILASLMIGVIIALIMTPMIIAGSSVDALIVPLVVVLFGSLVLLVIILSLTLTPYISASVAVFYREISEERYSNPYREMNEEFVIEESML